MPDENIPLEEILEAAEAAVAEQEEEPSNSLVIGLGMTAFLIAVIALVLGSASGGTLDGEQRALSRAAPPLESPETYARHLSVEQPTITFTDTIFGGKELRVEGVLHNAGDRVVAQATVVLQIKHLFGDEEYRYTFSPATPIADGVGSPGPLLAGGNRPFTYRAAGIPKDISIRVVRISWQFEDIAFHEELPIPIDIVTANRAA